MMSSVIIDANNPIADARTNTRGFTKPGWSVPPAAGRIITPRFAFVAGYARASREAKSPAARAVCCSLQPGCMRPTT